MKVSKTGTWDEVIKKVGFSSDRKYKTGHTILFQGEIPPQVLIVRKGFVAAYTIRNNGDEQIIALFSIGDILPVEWVFQRSPVALYYYRAFSDADVTGVPRDAFLAELQTNPVVANKLVAQLARSFISETVHIHALGHSHAREKFIKLLHYLVLRFGNAAFNASDTYTIPFKLTHTQIGSMIGITRESVSVEAVRLRKKGAFTIEKGFYTVKLPLLIQSLGGEEFNSLQLKATV